MKAKTAKRSGIAQKLKALIGSEIRVQALTILSDRTASPKEIADELGISVNRISHHVNVLHKQLDLIELVDEQPRRGAIEHFYRAKVRPIVDDDASRELGLDERRMLSALIMQGGMIDFVLADHAGTLDARIDRHLTRTPVVVDEQGWRELVELYGATFRETMEVHARSADRMASGDGKAVHVAALLSCFEVPPPRRQSS